MATPFDRGCDSRLAGEPESANPYTPGTAEFYAFKSGYRDVHLYWGRDAPNAPPLPEVKEHDVTRNGGPQ